jgi:plastocyanin
MRRVLFVAVVALAAVAAALAAPPGGGQVREVSIPGKVFVPGTLDVLVGDTVVWRNGDATTHTVTADNDSFDSGFLSPGATFAETFSKPGLYVYHCTIHKFMHGVVRVVPVALSAPDDAVVSGGRVVLSGLAPAGTEQVTVMRSDDSTKQRVVVPATDGSFTVTERVFRPVAYRALLGGVSSPLVHVEVEPKVVARARAGKLIATAKPSREGARAALQEYDLEHFAWRTIARSVLGPGSHVAISLPAEHRGRFRVVVRGGDGWGDGASQAVVRDH